MIETENAVQVLLRREVWRFCSVRPTALVASLEPLVAWWERLGEPDEAVTVRFGKMWNMNDVELRCIHSTHILCILCVYMYIYIYIIYMQYRLNVKLKCFFFMLCHLWQVLFAPRLWIPWVSLWRKMRRTKTCPSKELLMAHCDSNWLKLTAPQCHRTLKTKRMLPIAWKSSRSRCYDGMDLNGHSWIWMDPFIGDCIWQIWRFRRQVAKRKWILSQSPHGSRAQDQYDRKAAWASECLRLCLRFSECQCCQCLLLVLLVLFNQLVFFGFRHGHFCPSPAKRGSAVWIASSPRWWELPLELLQGTCTTSDSDDCHCETRCAQHMSHITSHTSHFGIWFKHEL